jgi:4'-phosphopantetheinyl transferase EntD
MALAGAPDGLLDWLRSQLPPGAAAAVRRIGAPDLSVFPEEARLITRAGDKRRLEFLAGRAAAREALPAIGHPPPLRCSPIPKETPSGRPRSSGRSPTTIVHA